MKLEAYVSFMIAGDTLDESYHTIEKLENISLNADKIPEKLPENCICFHFFEGIYNEDKTDFEKMIPVKPNMIYYVNADIISEKELKKKFEDAEFILEKVKSAKRKYGNNVGDILHLSEKFLHVTLTSYEIVKYKTLLLLDDVSIN
ncbi:TPA: hypothetical protein DEP21_02135 [Patescibacteria group bacterium]|nr:hypothetical protein [Candidatus Gracilibacteria bacterium]